MMMKAEQQLALKRCANHWQREAAARCPECRRFFCRECITEHEDRILCAGCLKRLALAGRTKSERSRILVRSFQLLIGLFLLWTVFYYVGKGLLLMPDEFHEGTVWQSDNKP